MIENETENGIDGAGHAPSLSTVLPMDNIQQQFTQVQTY